jgi:8-oxo-dGTP pyrophosphatase MutT (NUDIX family)
VTGRPDTRGDGDGWVECAQGHRHWGLYGAAGLLLRRTDDGDDQVLLQHRATWSHHGGTWGLLGGARHRGETAVDAALREAGEEGGLDGRLVRSHGRYDDAHGRWSYVTVLARAEGDVDARPTGGESIDVAWVPVGEVTGLPLHPGLAATWPWLHRALDPLTLVVDAANVVGSTPDGWWRDRAGAARRLLADLAGLVARGVPDAEMPDGLDRAPLRHWWPRVVVVLEGAARPAADAAPGSLDVVAAAGSGDDAVVEALRDRPGGPVVVVTADRALGERCRAEGGTVSGPRWLRGLLGAGAG